MTKKEYEKLKETIDYHMDRYYNLDQPEISDYEYDQLMIQLKEAEKQHPDWVSQDSPSQKIGGIAKREAGVKITHDVPMLSIEDVFDKKDVEAFVVKVKEKHPDASFSVEAKIDGLSATLRYTKKEDGKMHLDLCETRGDGFVGEDVTANALVIPDVQKTLDLPYEELQIRGEVYMSHEDFQRFNDVQRENGKKLAANPRNLAAGTLRQLDPAITKQRGLKMFVFNVQKGPKQLMESHVAGLSMLKENGVPVVYHEKCNTAEEVLFVIDKIAQLRGSWNYDIDGVVIKIDQVDYRKDFEAGSKYSSGHIAYKYPPEECVVVMDDILVNVGRTGKLTFTGVFHDEKTGEPARLCGTSVSRATLHNMDYIKEMKIGMGGAYKLYKSGEIIPKLNGCVKEPARIFEAPTKCPVCGDDLVSEEDSCDIRCINLSCPAQLTRAIAYFASLDCMNIVGLGETLIDDLVKEGYLKDYADIYYLKNHREELIENGILGKEKNTDKILAAIEASKDREVSKVLCALSIRNVGKTTAKDVMKHFNSLDELMNASMEQLVEIDDVGETTATCISEFFSDENNRKILEKLKNAGVQTKKEAGEDVEKKLEGLTIVVTGTLPTLSRKEAAELIETYGGKNTSSVSKKTSYVLAGEAAGSKLTKANELGIPVITEEEFLKMIQ
ncbi:MAG: NAD-dependent DNA ligase LigA [Lachnospiraceae bacterium]|nr:NAD-dependent DNA ligase LigA [Lachnospiraceae bacterium]